MKIFFTSLVRNQEKIKIIIKDENELHVVGKKQGKKKKQEKKN